MQMVLHEPLGFREFNLTFAAIDLLCEVGRQTVRYLLKKILFVLGVLISCLWLFFVLFECFCDLSLLSRDLSGFFLRGLVVGDRLPGLDLGQVECSSRLHITVNDILNEVIDGLVEHSKRKGSLVRSLLSQVECLNEAFINHLLCVRILHFFYQLANLLNFCVPLARNCISLSAKHFLKIFKNIKESF